MTSSAAQNYGSKFLITNLRSFSSCSAGDNVQNGAIISTNASDEGRKSMRTECNVATSTALWDKANIFENDTQNSS